MKNLVVDGLDLLANRYLQLCLLWNFEHPVDGVVDLGPNGPY